MEKKFYEVPEVELIDIEVAGMLAASDGMEDKLEPGIIDGSSDNTDDAG